MPSPQNLIKIGNDQFDESIDYLCWPYGASACDQRELEKLRLFPNLSGISFSYSDLEDAGLMFLSTIPQLKQLDLQGTEISNDGLSYLKKLEQLRYLRLKENFQLTNSCILHLKQIKHLENLQIQDTGINQAGLDRLAGKDSLKQIVLSLDDGNYAYADLLELSSKLPACDILVKGHGGFLNGTFGGTWTADH